MLLLKTGIFIGYYKKIKITFSRLKNITENEYEKIQISITHKSSAFDLHSLQATYSCNNKIYIFYQAGSYQC